MYSGANGFFGLTPEGRGQLFYDANSGYLGTSPYYLAQTQPQYQWKADGSFFFNTGSIGHELKAGFHVLEREHQLRVRQPGQPGSVEQPESGGQGGWLEELLRR